jgi:hypothetical protein
MRTCSRGSVCGVVQAVHGLREFVGGGAGRMLHFTFTWSHQSKDKPAFK